MQPALQAWRVLTFNASQTRLELSCIALHATRGLAFMLRLEGPVRALITDSNGAQNGAKQTCDSANEQKCPLACMYTCVSAANSGECISRARCSKRVSMREQQTSGRIQCRQEAVLFQSKCVHYHPKRSKVLWGHANDLFSCHLTFPACDRNRKDRTVT